MLLALQKVAENVKSRSKVAKYNLFMPTLNTMASVQADFLFPPPPPPPPSFSPLYFPFPAQKNELARRLESPSL